MLTPAVQFEVLVRNKKMISYGAGKSIVSFFNKEEK